MFSLFKKKDKKEEKPQGGIPSHILELRQTLYPQPLDIFVQKINEAGRSEFPWSGFWDADQALKNKDQARAIASLTRIVERPDLETRMYLQAWHTLAGLGVTPPEPLCGVIQGVVTEYYMKQGLDVVAAYKDHTARYWNFSGAGIVWEASDPKIDEAIDDLMKVGQSIMNSIGTKVEAAPDVPEKGVIRIYLMAFDGSCFGQGGYDNLYKDQMGKYAIGASYNLMTALMKKQEEQKKKS